MDMITTTDLRTKVPLLLQALFRGESVELIHRSKVVGEIKPKIRIPKPFDPDRFIDAVSKLDVPKITIKQARSNYRRHLEKRYGKGISRH